MFGAQLDVICVLSGVIAVLMLAMVAAGVLVLSTPVVVVVCTVAIGFVLDFKVNPGMYPATATPMSRKVRPLLATTAAFRLE